MKQDSALWECPLAEILEVRKATEPGKPVSGLIKSESTTATKSAALDLLIAPLHDRSSPMASTEEQDNGVNIKVGHVQEDYIYGMTEDHRNEAFNALIGIAASEAGVLWMELQPEPSWQMRIH